MELGWRFPSLSPVPQSVLVFTPKEAPRGVFPKQ